ncbi:MAG: hypothetical protein IPO90_10505 [Flavobacteriales bacterium]|nr:hypothetical protein [Flavobacteriales bacterium]
MRNISFTFIALVCTAFAGGVSAQVCPGGVRGSQTYLGLSFSNADSVAWLSGTTDSMGGCTLDTIEASLTNAVLGALNYHPTLLPSATTPSIPIEAIAREQLSVFAVVGPRSNAAEHRVFSLGDHDTSGLAFTTRRVLRTGDMAYLNDLGMPGCRPLGLFERNNVIRAHDMELRLDRGFAQPTLPVDTALSAIPELHLYYRVITKHERAKIGSYLAMKYGITLKGAYVSSAGDTLWSTSSAEHYGNRVVALGRDDGSGLHQKQSTSANEPSVVVLAADTIVNWNHDNPATLQVDQFLLCGDDGGDLKWAPRQAGKPQVLRRHWLAQCTGADLLNGVIRFDRSAITNEPEIAQRIGWWWIGRGAVRSV